MHDITHVEQFLHFIDPKETVFTFCFLDAQSKEPVKGYGTVTTSLEELPVYLSSLDTATLHVTLNRTNGKGRKTKDIESARVLCVDLDRSVSLEEVKAIKHDFLPSCIVESSPARYHLYWRLSPTVSLQQWAKYQLALACYFKGDQNLASLSKTIRVPGVSRICKDGTAFTPSIKFLDAEAVELDDASIISVFPWIEEYYTKAAEQRQEERKNLMKMIRQPGTHNGAEGAKFSATGRNNALFTAVYSWVKMCTYENEASALQWAIEFNENFNPPLDKLEVEKTVHSAYMRADAARVKRAEKLADIKAELPPAPVEFQYDYTAKWLSEDRFSAPSVVERVLQKFDGHLVRTGSLVYAFDTDSRVWRSQKTTQEILDGYANEACFDTIKDPKFIETLCLSEDGDLSQAKKQAAQNRLSSHQFISGTITRILSSKRITRKEISSFDNDPNLVYCGNGVLDITTLKLKEASAKDYLLHQTPILWNESAECPWWENFVAELFSENVDPAAMVSFIRALFGYSLTGSVDEQRVFIHQGGGCNGKSKVLDTLAMLGGAYTTRISGSSLSKNKKALQQEFNRLGAKIEGKRIAVLDDLDTNTQWNEGTVKNLTSKELTARNLYNEERDIPNRSKIHIGCNQVPQVEAESEGIIRRLCLISYGRMFEQDAGKEAEIRAMTEKEASGILRWAIEGIRACGGKLVYPEETLIAAKEYRSEQFKLEGVIESIFERPAKGQEEWHVLSELLTDVEEALTKVRAVDRAPSAETLGRMLKQKYHYLSERKYHSASGNKATFYLIKRKFKNNDSTGML